ncbi:MAG: putative cytochrome bd-I oxidase subunit [Actinomycetia bacterium]|nr:putative cytochrome bd-I oxidase subunit [Actinomycetes bacterium]
MAEAVAAIMFAGVVLYAVFGGADYGCGLWDLTAGGIERGGRIRAQIDRSIGPVWEANHVWLIFVLVFLWSGFPRAFAAVMTSLPIPFAVVGLGVIFRGGAFVFRKSSATAEQARLHGVVFAVASIVTPFFLGVIAGAIADGQVVPEGHPNRLWTGPLSLVGGVLAALTCSFLAATLLAADAEKAGDDDLAAAFGRRALLAGAAAGVAALGAAVTIERYTSTLADGLHGKAAPLVVVSAACGLLSLLDLRGGRWARARVGAVGAVAAVVIGWGVAQYPDLLVGGGTIDELAGARATLAGLLVVTALAAALVVPSLVWLYVLVERPSWNRPVSEGGRRPSWRGRRRRAR